MNKIGKMGKEEGKRRERRAKNECKNRTLKINF